MTSDCPHPSVLPDFAAILQGLADRGLVSPPWDVQKLTGNVDRKPERQRTHLLLRPAIGPALKLTIGPMLAETRDKALHFAAAMPQLCAREVFFVRLGAVDVWAVEAIDGTSIEDLDTDGASAARLLAGLETLASIQRTGETPRAASSLEFEWESFTDELTQLSCWTGDERAFLADRFLPRLRERLIPTCNVQRWTNGDFTSSNIRLRPDGRPVLFDAEFSAISHFIAEETVRFRRISPLCHRHPALLAGWWPEPEPAWEVFFQLRQLCLEHRENSTAYVARVYPHRKAVVRKMAESAALVFPSTWPAPEDPEPSFCGEPVQLFWRDVAGAFCERASRTVTVRTGTRQLAGFRLPARATAWRLDPAASRRPILIHSLTAIVEATGRYEAASIPFDVAGACVARRDTGWAIEPTGPDPQLHFALPPHAVGIVLDLHCT